MFTIATCKNCQHTLRQKIFLNKDFKEKISLAHRPGHCIICPCKKPEIEQEQQKIILLENSMVI